MKSRPCVFVVDDEAAVRDSLAFLIQSAGLDAETFASAQAFLDYYDGDRSGCVVLDVKMPGMSGLALQEELERRGLPIPVIVMSAHADVPTSVKAMKQGALDFLEKPFTDDDLLDRINEALALDGERRRQNKSRQNSLERLQRLTGREREVMELVVKGKANKIIAAELGLSVKTVEVHRGNVMRKMEADSLAQLVAAALRSKDRD